MTCMGKVRHTLSYKYNFIRYNKLIIVINFAESKLEFRKREFQTKKKERDFR